MARATAAPREPPAATAAPAPPVAAAPPAPAGTAPPGGAEVRAPVPASARRRARATGRGDRDRRGAGAGAGLHRPGDARPGPRGGAPGPGAAAGPGPHRRDAGRRAAPPIPRHAAAPAARAAAPLATLTADLARLVADVATGAVDGRRDALQRAVAQLGVGLEHALSHGRAPEEAPVRALLLALASHTGADPALARAAATVADAVGAQALAGSTLPPPPGADPASNNGAYLQLPLPGGGTAEIRVAPDGGGESSGGGRPRRLAFLLHLSALGPVMVEATAGPGGVDATVRAADEGARRFLDTLAPELADALRRTSARASVSVERLGGPPPERLLPPPPPPDWTSRRERRAPSRAAHRRRAPLPPRGRPRAADHRRGQRPHRRPHPGDRPRARPAAARGPGPDPGAGGCSTSTPSSRRSSTT